MNKLYIFDDNNDSNNKKKSHQKSYHKKRREPTITDKNTEYGEEQDKSKKFNFCKYIGYLTCCKRKNKTLKYYERFRIKIISEENIITNYFNVYNLLNSKIRKNDFEGD